LSFYHRYIPHGILEHPPQKINQKPPKYVGRDEMETLLASGNSADWIKIRYVSDLSLYAGNNNILRHQIELFTFQRNAIGTSSGPLCIFAQTQGGVMDVNVMGLFDIAFTET